jgi:hypothetical protein
MFKAMMMNNTHYMIDTEGEIESRSGYLYLVHYYVIKFVSDLQQDGGFFWVHRFRLYHF